MRVNPVKMLKEVPVKPDSDAIQAQQQRVISVRKRFLYSLYVQDYYNYPICFLFIFGHSTLFDVVDASIMVKFDLRQRSHPTEKTKLPINSMQKFTALQTPITTYFINIPGDRAINFASPKL